MLQVSIAVLPSLVGLHAPPVVVVKLAAQRRRFVEPTYGFVFINGGQRLPATAVSAE